MSIFADGYFSLQPADEGQSPDNESGGEITGTDPQQGKKKRKDHGDRLPSPPQHRRPNCKARLSSSVLRLPGGRMLQRSAQGLTQICVGAGGCDEGGKDRSEAHPPTAPPFCSVPAKKEREAFEARVVPHRYQRVAAPHRGSDPTRRRDVRWGGLLPERSL